MSSAPKLITDIPGKDGVDKIQQQSYDANYGAHKVGIKSREMVEYYNKWSSYDQDLSPDVYKGPEIIAQVVNRHLQGKTNTKILDVGAGSGRVAYELSKHGFKKIHALEPAKMLLEKSEYKQYYEKCFYVLVGNESNNAIKDDEYDAVVVAGAFGEGHIPCLGLNDIIRMVKPGGLVMIVMRKEYLDYVKEYRDRLLPYMAELVKMGKWKKEEHMPVTTYSFGKPGLVFVYRVVESGFNTFKSSVLKE